MDRSGQPAIRMAAQDLAARLADLCPAHGIDLAGAVGLPCPLPLAGRFLSWLQEDRHGGLEYMWRNPADRLDPARRRPQATSLLVFAQRYTQGWPAEDPDPSAGGLPTADVPWTARVARYARGEDYHQVLLGAIEAVLAGLRDTWPRLEARASTDTGPYLEREYAWLAGLGFLGKNTCLIHERLGSGLFLGVALTNLEIGDLPAAGRACAAPLYGIRPRRARPPRLAYLSACGRCTRCIDACPTGAIGPAGGLDAGRCLATWTIERRGETPAGCAHQQGGILFGCDICQAVCPWNGRAARRDAPPPERRYACLTQHAELTVPDLAVISAAEFGRRFRRTPLWRCHPEGLQRNARTVLANIQAEDPS